MTAPEEGDRRMQTEGGTLGPQATPFEHRIRVRWGDCDPAAIAYTPNIPAWALEAIESWWSHHTDHDWYRFNIDRRIGTPFVHMRLDFRAPITPRHPLDCAVRMTRLGRTSVTHEVSGYQDGVLCFTGEFVAVFVEAGAMTPIGPPEDVVDRIRATIAPPADSP
ncbi:thioesterase family protein [uncultured Rhodospira sp.]|uniref:acyl-CoA thioesterase n=1 Tax=uncultured Rhodospira sp. TaxID=1936189 RepID=UPI0026072E59|nr:thioesterase family protein [uncultured Rhodospira sp.]